MGMCEHMTDLLDNDPPGLPPDIGRRVRSWACDVARKAGVRAYYNRRNRSVHLCLGDPTVGVAAYEVYRNGRWSLPTRDAACSAIYAGRLPRAVKDMRLAASHREASEASRAVVRSDIDARRPDMKENARRIFRGRKSLAVDGLGGSNGSS